MRKYLKGFSRFMYFPLVENTFERYLVGEGILIPSAQKLSKEIDSSEEEVNADDEVWDIDKTVNGEKFTLTLKELSNDLRAKLEGGKYDPETREYSFATTDNAPEFACTYRGLLADGTYRMFRQYKCKVTKIKMDLETKGNGNSGTVEIEGMFMPRAYDNKLFTDRDTTTGNADLTWLDTIPSIPETIVPEPTLEVLTITSEEGEEDGKTAITINPELTDGNSYKYKVATNPTLPEYDAVCSSGYTNWDGTSEITATTGQKIVVVEVDENNKAKKAGIETVTAKAE